MAASSAPSRSSSSPSDSFMKALLMVRDPEHDWYRPFGDAGKPGQPRRRPVLIRLARHRTGPRGEPLPGPRPHGLVLHPQGHRLPRLQGAALATAPGVGMNLATRAPESARSGAWFDAAALPESLIAVLAETGRHYLPWVARATREVPEGVYGIAYLNPNSCLGSDGGARVMHSKSRRADAHHDRDSARRGRTHRVRPVPRRRLS